LKRKLTIGAALVALVVALGVGAVVLQRAAVQAAGIQAPRFEVDPIWPKPLPNHWILGMTIGVSVDAQDHIWIIHRQGSLDLKETYSQQNPVAGDCCAAAPPVLEFDEDAGRVQDTTGRFRRTESQWIIKATCGLVAMATARAGLGL
jgi:hypothetical protein